MSNRRSALGRGLGALISTPAAEEASEPPVRRPEPTPPAASESGPRMLRVRWLHARQQTALACEILIGRAATQQCAQQLAVAHVNGALQAPFKRSQLLRRLARAAQYRQRTRSLTGNQSPRVRHDVATHGTQRALR